jgi:hypothetical protein
MAGIESYRDQRLVYQRGEQSAARGWRGTTIAAVSSGAEILLRANTDDQALSGLILTVLAAECHRYREREDEAFRTLLDNLLGRLRRDDRVNNPVNQAEELTKPADARKVSALIEALENTLREMQKLDRANCRRSEALRVWKNVFKTDYFDSEISRGEEDERRQSEEKVAAATAAPRPWCG